MSDWFYLLLGLVITDVGRLLLENVPEDPAATEGILEVMSVCNDLVFGLAYIVIGLVLMVVGIVKVLR